MRALIPRYLGASVSAVALIFISAADMQMAYCAEPAKARSSAKTSKPKPTTSAPAIEVTPAGPQSSSECTLAALDPQSNRSVSYTVRLPAPGSRQRASACLLPARQAIQQAGKSELLLVDVRPLREYERYRIAGSLNMPLTFVKTKPFLKNRPFALVNEGRDSAQLEAACQELRAQGFARATVLQGGLSAWRRAKGALDGDALAQRELTRMHHAEFADEGNYADWVVVSIASAPPKDVQALFPQAVSVPATDEADKLVAAVKSAVARRTRKGAEPKVLVVDDDGTRYDRIEAAMTAALAQNVFFLDGGVNGYRKFWSEQATIWAAAAKPPRKPACGA